ncbi:MAG TPA: FHA domain-containing protein, partial [Anaerolineae bacterium]|nr:FHA domain-containing protein [Anaerolineae bacterium]
REATRPPLVTGTLYHWPRGNQAAAEPADLTALKRTEVSIGRGDQCDLVIPDPSLAGEHAILRAEKVVDQVQVLLVPVAEVRMGYRVIREAMPLRHGDTFTMGEREFQYLSDEGE